MDRNRQRSPQSRCMKRVDRLKENICAVQHTGVFSSLARQTIMKCIDRRIRKDCRVAGGESFAVFEEYTACRIAWKLRYAVRVIVVLKVTPQKQRVPGGPVDDVVQ